MGNSLESLRQISARLGRNADLTRAGGGNTSLKADGNLWIKASGKWLAGADQEDIFVPVPLAEVTAALERGEDYVAETGGLRPSVETVLHAVLPHTCVVHVHSVNVLAWAALADSPRIFAANLEGIRWAWIPYAHPGMALARNVRGVTADVLIVQNHGLVVGGESCESTEALLHYVERRLHLPMRVTPAPRTQTLRELAGSEWQVATDPDVHGLGTDPDSFRIACEGTLYPDHCVHLGHAVAPCYHEEPANEAASHYEQKWGRRPSILACEGLGVLTDPALSRSGREMLACLAAVARRIPVDCQVRYLAVEDVARLMSPDFELRRQAAARPSEAQ